MWTAPSAGVLLLMLMVLTRSHGNARPHLHSNRCLLPGKTIQQTLSLLRNVGSLYSSECLNLNVSVPRNISTNHSTCSSVQRLVQAALQGAGHVFDNNEPNLGVGGVLWDDRKLDDFQNLLYQVLEHPCMSRLNSSGILDQYYSDITELIQRQDPCGWLALRTDLMRILRTSLFKHHHCFSWN
ncbi:unnamed protein product [Knipowitschia caucasica]